MALFQHFKQRRLISRAKMLRQRCELLTDIDDVVTEVLTFKEFSLIQKHIEFVSLIRIVEKMEPKTICDIGSLEGGTLRVFAHYAAPEARILSIDIGNSPMRMATFPHLIRSGQELTVIDKSSYSMDTIAYVKEWLNGDKIDFLFIDGDHAYDGVSKDYALYSPLVSDNGLIGIHDIVEDYKARYGEETENYAGGVPALWKEIKGRVPYTNEFIEDINQDGFGIGVVSNQEI